MTAENKPMISIVAAMAQNRVIGQEGKIPWDLPNDRRRFRELTWGHPVILGRKTFESIGHPLPGRKNIILTRQENYAVEGCVVVRDLDQAIDNCTGNDEVFICGGGEVYAQAMPRVEKLYITLVHVEPQGDTLFPPISAQEFVEVERRKVEDLLPCDFVVYARRQADDVH